VKPRTDLVKEIFRIMHDLQPAFVFLENVPEISTRADYFELLAKLSDSASYDVHVTYVCAADVGAEHLRKRWFALALHKTKAPWPPPWISPCFDAKHVNKLAQLLHQKLGVNETIERRNATTARIASRLFGNAAVPAAAFLALHKLGRQCCNSQTWSSPSHFTPKQEHSFVGGILKQESLRGHQWSRAVAQKFWEVQPPLSKYVVEPSPNPNAPVNKRRTSEPLSLTIQRNLLPTPTATNCMYSVNVLTPRSLHILGSFLLNEKNFKMFVGSYAASFSNKEIMLHRHLLAVLMGFPADWCDAVLPAPRCL